jgi:hypothetical protein
MKKMKNEKRVINIPKEDFDHIKKYCDEHSLDMAKWVLNNSLEKLKKEFFYEGMISVSEVKEIFENSSKVNMPKNWKSIVMETISNGIRSRVIHGGLDKYSNVYTWNPIIQVENMYGLHSDLSLSESQTSEIIGELTSRGFTVMKSDYTVLYFISW